MNKKQSEPVEQKTERVAVLTMEQFEAIANFISQQPFIVAEPLVAHLRSVRFADIPASDTSPSAEVKD